MYKSHRCPILVLLFLIQGSVSKDYAKPKSRFQISHLKLQDRRFSVRQVAQRIGVEPAYLSKIERGDVAPPSEAKIRALAEELGEDPDVLLAMAGKVSSDLQGIIRKRPQLFADLIDSSHPRRTTPSCVSPGMSVMATGNPGRKDNDCSMKHTIEKVCLEVPVSASVESFPLDGAWGFRGNVIDHPIYPLDFIDNPIGEAM